MGIDFSNIFPKIFGSSEKAEKNETQSQKQEGGSKCKGPGLLSGFPFVNYGRARYAVPRALTIPRTKYTWFAEMVVNEDYLKSGRLVTNLDHFLKNDNRIYLNLKQIDHPKPNVATETLRSYNKYVKTQTKVEYPPAQMTFDDDATSMTVALWKEYFAFYSHAGDIGWQMLLGTDNVSHNREDLTIMNDEAAGSHGYSHLVSVDGSTPRISMDLRASLGMRLKSDKHRHFFDRIVIYDLGTEPDSVNIYYYHRPVITSWDHGGLDWEDRTGKVEVNVTFEYENYYFALGKERWTVRDTIMRMTGQELPLPTTRGSDVSNDHGDMRVPEFPAVPQGVETPIFEEGGFGTPDPFTGPVDPPRSTTDIEKDRRKLNTRLQDLLERCSSARNDPECLKEEKQINDELARLDQDMTASRQYENEQTNAERGTESTQDALTNTQNSSGIQASNPTAESAVRTTAQTQALETQLQVTQSTKTKLENTEQSLTDVIAGIENALALDDAGKIENTSSGKISRESREGLEELLRTRQRELRQVEVEIGLVEGRENQLKKQLGL